MAAARDPITAVTPQQEQFAQLLAAPKPPSPADAYRQAYSVSLDTLASTVYESASRLAANPNVAARIQQLKELAQKQVVESHAWTLERLTTEAEINLRLAREHKQLGSANGALELIGRVTGIISEHPVVPQQAITRVVVVLNRGNDAEGRPIIEEAAYKVLPAGEDDEPLPSAE